MQDNTIILSVDTTNDGTPENQEYVRHEEQLNRSTYRGPLHQPDSRNLMQLYRTPATRNGESRGASKCAIKFTKDISVPNASGSGDIILPLIGEVSFSLPVGVTAAQNLELRQRLIAILDDDSTVGDLMDLQEI